MHRGKPTARKHGIGGLFQLALSLSYLAGYSIKTILFLNSDRNTYRLPNQLDFPQYLWNLSSPSQEFASHSYTLESGHKQGEQQNCAERVLLPSGRNLCFFLHPKQFLKGTPLKVVQFVGLLQVVA